MATTKKILTEENIMQVLNALYEKSLNGIPAVSVPVAEMADDYLIGEPEVKKAVKSMHNSQIAKCTTSGFLTGLGSAPLDNRASLAELLKRPEVTYEGLSVLDPQRPQLSYHVRTKVEVGIKYSGYIEKQLLQIEKFKKLETRKIPEGIDYLSLDGLRTEAQEKLDKFRPVSIGQASRISGVSPADINVLLVYLEKLRRSV